MLCSTSALVRDPEAWVSGTLVGRFLRSCPARGWVLAVRELLGMRVWSAFLQMEDQNKKAVTHKLRSPDEGDSEESR
jgi:hypothetical protein